MRNEEEWQPTKVRVAKDGKIIVPGNPDELFPGSILIATLISRWYAYWVPRFARGLLVELGCGKMPFYPFYRPHVDHVFCTDWTQSLHGVTFLDFATDLNCAVPLKDCTVDTIVASDVLEHIYKPQILLQEMSRVLRPGGIAFINMPFIYWVHEAPHDFFRYTPDAIRRMAEEAGFSVERIDSLGGGLICWADITGKLCQSIPIIGGWVSKALQRATLAMHGSLPQSGTWPLTVAAILRKPVSERSTT